MAQPIKNMPLFQYQIGDCPNEPFRIVDSWSPFNSLYPIVNEIVQKTDLFKQLDINESLLINNEKSNWNNLREQIEDITDKREWRNYAIMIVLIAFVFAAVVIPFAYKCDALESVWITAVAMALLAIGAGIAAGKKHYDYRSQLNQLVKSHPKKTPLVASDFQIQNAS